MHNLVEVNSISKKYKTFNLKDISFEIESGKVVGLIGQNGNGKTTIIKCLLNIISFDGNINIFEKDNLQYEKEIKEEIGFVFDEMPFDDNLNAHNISVIMKSIYKKWSDEKYNHYLDKFGLIKKQKVKEYSKGMQTKLMLAVALSHEARLLILDEPTSGLDPLFRREILDELKAFVSDGKRSVLFSTHITSDLEYIADSIVFISEGKVIFNGSKKEMQGIYHENEKEPINAIDDMMVEMLKRGK